MKRVMLLPFVFAIACSSPTQPSNTPSMVDSRGATSVSASWHDQTPPRLAWGPTGCVDAKDLASVVQWAVVNVPPDAHIDMAYFYSPTVDCEPTAENYRRDDLIRTWHDVSAGVAYLEFHQFLPTACKGKKQVDMTVNGQLVVGVIIKEEREFTGGACTPRPCILNGGCH